MAENADSSFQERAPTTLPGISEAAFGQSQIFCLKTLLNLLATNSYQCKIPALVRTVENSPAF